MSTQTPTSPGTTLNHDGSAEVITAAPAPAAPSTTVNVGNLPTVQPVSGTVAVSNLPATQAVSGTVSVGNFPATQTVAGAVSVSNLPATQAVSGTVSVGNFPASQAVTDTATATIATNTTKSATAATDANRFAVTPPDMLSFSGSVTSAIVVGNTLDTTGYGSVVVQLTNAGTGCTIVYEQSNDNATWVPAFGFIPGNSLASQSNADNTVQLRVFPAQTRYFRVRVSTYGSGTVTASAYARTASIPQYDPQTATRTVSVSSLVAPFAPANSGILQAAAKVSTAASTNATLLRASAAAVLGYQFSNTAATWAYVKLFNLATAPVPGTSATTLVVAVPPNGVITYEPPYGLLNFTAGLGYSVTGGYADTDTTAVAAGQVIGNILYR